MQRFLHLLFFSKVFQYAGFGLKKKQLRVKQGAGTVLVEALTKRGILKEAAEKFGVEADDINLVYNSGKTWIITSV